MRRLLRIAAAVSLTAALVGVAASGAAGTGAPSCAEGPVRHGDTIVGTACPDLIVAPASVATVRGGGGDDTIVAAAQPQAGECEGCLFLDVGSQTFEGGPGDDIVFGQRGNDTLKGGAGNDRLYGGIGDDTVLGGPGDDLLSGGFGADSLDGEAGSDYVRGDGTIDRIRDSGAAGDTDVLSYSTGVTPGFTGTYAQPEEEGFPSPGGERGLRFDLGQGGQNAKQGIAQDGGGVDEVAVGAFETLIGTAFSDLIDGITDETVYGGGGADKIDAAPVEAARETNKVSVGFMVPDQSLGAQLYLVGSEGGDEVVATYSASSVAFTLSGGAQFDQPAAEAAGCEVSGQTAHCELKAPLDSLLLAGMGGDDRIEADGFPAFTAVVAIGGAGSDDLVGGTESEDVLVDGPDGGDDTLEALAGDDALLHNGGADLLRGGEGNDLFLSVSICDAETIDGGGGRDNASWARLGGEPVEARLDLGLAGEPGGPSCPGGAAQRDHLQDVEDLEGSGQADVLYGDAGPNQLLGHKGEDTYRALAGDDRILANSAVGEPDPDPVIDCGADADVAIIDLPTAAFADAAPIECETVVEAAPNDFSLPPPLPEPPPAEPPLPALDTTAPRTRIIHRPPHNLTVRRGPRRVSFAFRADEPARFRCRIDRRPYRDCSSPFAFRVGRGRHVFRVFAVDAAGNRDATVARAVLHVHRVAFRRHPAHRRP